MRIIGTPRDDDVYARAKHFIALNNVVRFANRAVLHKGGGGLSSDSAELPCAGPHLNVCRRGGTICRHNGLCFECGFEKLKAKKEYRWEWQGRGTEAA